MYLRKQFLDKICGTSATPSLFEVSKAKGSYLYNQQGEAYLDLSSGFSVNNIGHSNEKVIQAATHQMQQYMHTTVYGEHVQHPQVQYASKLLDFLPSKLNQLFFLNAGTEVVDAAIKLIRKYTGRQEIIVCKKAYHGSSVGAESLRSDIDHSQKYRPLIPGITFIEFNNVSDVEKISTSTAGVIMEVIQSEAGILEADVDFLQGIVAKCKETGSLVVFDEIQTGMGRTGTLFAFQKSSIIPDILLSGKALGGGMPLAALISSTEIIKCLNENPALGHLSTFGGHPVSCASGLTAFEVLLTEDLMNRSLSIAGMVGEMLIKQDIRFRNSGLFFAIDVEKKDIMSVLNNLFKSKILAEGFLFCPNYLRFAPPLIIEENDVIRAIEKIISEIKK